MFLNYLRETLNLDAIPTYLPPPRQRVFIYPEVAHFKRVLDPLPPIDRLLKCFEVENEDFKDVFKKLSPLPQNPLVISLGCGGSEELSLLLERHPELEYIGLDNDQNIVDYNNTLWQNEPRVRFINHDIMDAEGLSAVLAGRSPDLILLLHPLVLHRGLDAINTAQTVAGTNTQMCITCAFAQEDPAFRQRLDKAINNGIFTNHSIEDRFVQGIRRTRNGTVFTATIVPIPRPSHSNNQTSQIDTRATTTLSTADRKNQINMFSIFGVHLTAEQSRHQFTRGQMLTLASHSLGLD